MQCLVFNCCIRIGMFTDSFRFAMSMSLLPTSSYAYSACMYQRLVRLIFHACWLNLVWGISTYLIVQLFAKPITLIFSNGDSFVAAAIPMMKNANTESTISWVRYVIQAMLQSLSFGGSATIYSILSYFVVNIGTYCLLYYTNKTNVPRMMYAYSISAAISIIIGAFFVICNIFSLFWSKKSARIGLFFF